MTTPEQKQELSERYLKELLKVGFDQKQAAEIVAEAADRLGADVDKPKQYIPVIQPRTLEEARGWQAATPEQVKARRAVQVITRKERQFYPAHVTWTALKQKRMRPGPNKTFMEAMQEQMAAEMKRLEFTQADIDFILGN